MTKFEAIEQKERMAVKARWRCVVCGKRLSFNEMELAHRIPKHKKYLRKYGPEIIHHPFNMRITCSKHNSTVLIDPATHPIEAEELVREIKEYLKRGKK